MRGSGWFVGTHELCSILPTRPLGIHCDALNMLLFAYNGLTTTPFIFSVFGLQAGAESGVSQKGYKGDPNEVTSSVEVLI